MTYQNRYVILYHPLPLMEGLGEPVAGLLARLGRDDPSLPASPKSAVARGRPSKAIIRARQSP